MSARQFCLPPRCRSTVLLTAAVIGIALVLSCSSEDAGSAGGAAGHSGAAGGTPVAGAGGSAANSAGGTSEAAAAGGGSGGRAESTGGRGGASGGPSSTGGATAGGGSAGNGGAAGTEAAGSGGAGGSETTCPLPKSFKWTSTGPLAQPKAGWVSLKNFSDVVFNNQHIVYYSGGTTAGKWAGGMMTFADWADMATATQNTMPMLSAAPTLIYFTPKKIWVLMYQYGQWTFMYSTSTDPTSPSSWSAPHELYNGGGIDNTVICNSTTCYLFVTNDSGHVYRSSMPIDNFPSTFPNATTIMTDTTANLFEAEQVYAVKGTNQYLMVVEALGGAGRYFRSFTATDLGGSWTPLAASESTPFAGKANVTFSDGDAWTTSISHGDVVRTNPDETQTIDPCNLQFLYQGDRSGSGGSYIQIPYRPGLLTLVR
jgi:hypothetical protein